MTFIVYSSNRLCLYLINPIRLCRSRKTEHLRKPLEILTSGAGDDFEFMMYCMKKHNLPHMYTVLSYGRVYQSERANVHSDWLSYRSVQVPK